MKFSRILDWIIITLGLLSTVLVTVFVFNKNKMEDTLRFQYETEEVLARIQARMQSYEGTLVQLRAFLKNSGDLNRDKIQKYIRDTEIFERFPGLQGIGYTMMLHQHELESHTRLMQKELPDYHVFPKGTRDIYSSIIVLEPEDRRNKKAIGFDMFSEKFRKKAMEEARDQDKAIMTGMVVLVQEDEAENLPGFNLYLPHYKKDHLLNSIENRRKALLGFVYSPFRAHDLFKAILRDEKILDVEIYADNMNPKNLYYDHYKSDEQLSPTATNELLINGRKLIVKTSALPEFPRASSLINNLLVFVSGTFITLLIYSIYLFTRKQMHIARVVAEEKEKLLEKEKEHVASRDDFLSIASHELKTPLTSLKLQAQVMMRSISRNDPAALSKEKVSHLVKQIDNQTTRLTRLVDDMLDISRIRTGRLKIVRDTVNLNEVILDVIDRLKPQFIKTIGETPDHDLFPDIVGSWDRFRLEQVLTNLFTNAIRYGNGNPIKIRTELEGRCVRIYVTDEGIGIAKENIVKIFERFERAGMSASEVSGLGLGLFITAQIVKAHGGEIRVESELGKGSTFIVELPLDA